MAAAGDGTIRWYRASDLEELLALFPYRDGQRWLLCTPGRLLVFIYENQSMRPTTMTVRQKRRAAPTIAPL